MDRFISMGPAFVTLLVAALFALPSVAGAQFDPQPPEDQYGQPPGTQPTPTPTPTPPPNGGPGEDEEPAGEGEEQGGGGGNRGDDGKAGPGGGAGPDTSERGGLPLREAEGGSLPFTGLDLTLLVLIGLLLAGAGFALRAAQRTAAARGTRS